MTAKDMGIRAGRPTARATASAVAAAALLLAGCGGSSSGSGSSGSGGSKSASVSTINGNAIARAADVSTSAAGYKIAMTLQETIPELGGQITGNGSGAFNLPKRSGSMTINLTLPGGASALGNLVMHEVVLGQNIYMELPSLIASRLPGGKPWIQLNVAKLGQAAGISGLSSLTGGAGSTDPGQFLQYLAATSTSGIKDLGPATVDGIPTTHYSGSVDLSKVADKVPASQRSAAGQAVAALQKLTKLSSLPVNVYVDSAHLVRRLTMSYQETTNGQTFSTNMQLDFTAYGPQPVPTAPPAGQVSNLSALIGSLGSLAGSATGSSGAGG
jgi:hypothetical protein